MAPAGDSTSSVTTGIDKLSVNGGHTGKTIIGRCDMQLGEVTHHNVMVTTAGELARLAYFNDIVVGAVCCRHDEYEKEKALYIMTLGTLAPYRKLGVGRLLVEHVISLARKDPSIANIFLHVQGVEENYYKRIEPDSAYLLVKKIDRK